MLFSYAYAPVPSDEVKFTHPSGRELICNLSPTSVKRLSTVHFKLASVVAVVSRFCPLVVVEGHRRQARQDHLFEMKKSKLPWPESKHNLNPSEAVDLAPLPLDWEDRDRFVALAGAMWMESQLLGLHLRWGGSWSRDGFRNPPGALDDLGHFELFSAAGLRDYIH